MNTSQFHVLLAAIAAGFSLFFAVTVVPPLIADFDPLGALAAGFVNPYASGYSTDVIMCWLVLAVWVMHDRRQLGIRHGGICLLLGLVPGVAVGFAVYLVVRQRQLGDNRQEAR